MSLHDVIAASFQRSFTLYRDLISTLDEPSLAWKLKPLRSNTIGLQLWCVIGARESYSKAIVANQWQGFECSLNTTTDHQVVADSLKQSEQTVLTALRSAGEFSDTQHQLLVTLLEHEASHHGQLIRYLYGLDIPIPDSWRTKYALM